MSVSVGEKSKHSFADVCGNSHMSWEKVLSVDSIKTYMYIQYIQ